MQIPTVAMLLRNDNVFTTLNYIIPKKSEVIEQVVAKIVF